MYKQRFSFRFFRNSIFIWRKRCVSFYRSIDSDLVSFEYSIIIFRKMCVLKLCMYKQRFSFSFLSKLHFHLKKRMCRWKHGFSLFVFLPIFCKKDKTYEISGWNSNFLHVPMNRIGTIIIMSTMSAIVLFSTDKFFLPNPRCRHCIWGFKLMHDKVMRIHS